MKVLYVEDESDMALIVSESLRFNGFEVDHFNNPTAALSHFRVTKPDIIILDVMLPGMSGISLAQLLKSAANHIPIIFVTAKTHIRDVTAGFETGANDYLKKPFMVEELILRIRALLRAPVTREHYVFGEFKLNYMRQELSRMGVIKKLSYRECVILQQLALNVGTVIPRDLLIEKSGQDNPDLNGRSLDVFISRLRTYLRADPRIRIQAIKKIGYKLAVDP
ncbi:response regulator transcription factor [Pedobacter sp. UBA5917]|jgi:DNA-binding response OmpR family regulator|uniref:response regulator transcription factor n=1 Tax=Pedobacter sp. UBA5917 TaxID=1947061 RepID=UPI0025E1195C|nr:response regulator transcription factor [Pedobacter sp. UBA5917]